MLLSMELLHGSHLFETLVILIVMTLRMMHLMTVCMEHLILAMAVHFEHEAVAREMDHVCETYASVFAKPGKPALSSIKYPIDLLDESA